jgi:hypothetical protein
MQERRYLGLRKVSIPRLDDKLKLVGHFGMCDMLQLVGEVGKKRLLRMQERRHLCLLKVSIPALTTS